MRYSSLLFGAPALFTSVLAQTWTECNPLNSTCPNNPGFGIAHNFVFNTSETLTKSFNITNGVVENFGSTGAEFIVAKQNQSPTVKSQFYIFFGSVSVVMKAAPGVGIVSSIVLQSEDLDEIDWEFIGGNGTHAQTNFFGKGNTTSYDRAVWHPVSSDVRENFHNYTVDWTSEKMDFYIDGEIVRTLPYGDPKANYGNNYPQTPVTVRLGIWAGGDPENNNEGTVEWAGGKTDFSQAPFNMYVQSANVHDYGTGKEYEWSDQSGSFASIKSIAGNSTAAENINKVVTPSKSVSEKFKELPQSTKLAIYGGCGAAAAVLLSALLFTCIRQRRKGHQEREAYNAKVEKEREESYRDQMELREKGLGGWDNNSYASQGDDALGGWGGTHVTPGTKAADAPPVPAMPSNLSTRDLPSRVNTPQPGGQSPTVPLISPMPQSSNTWNGGNSGGLVQNAGNAYNGGYNSGYGGGYAGPVNNIPGSSNFPLSGGSRGFPNNGYQRF